MVEITVRETSDYNNYSCKVLKLMSRRVVPAGPYFI